MASNEYTIWERIVDKILSARFLIVLVMYATLCFAVVQSFRIVGIECTDKELLTFRKEIFLYVMGVFSGLIGGIGTSYFTRTDRKDKTTK
jgi:hypothetical protein